MTDIVTVYGLCVLVLCALFARRSTQPLWAGLTVLFAAVVSMYRGWL